MIHTFLKYWISWTQLFFVVLYNIIFLSISSKLYKFPPFQTTTVWILRLKVPSPWMQQLVFLTFIYPWYQWLPTLWKNQKSTILWGHWSVCWPITRTLKGQCMASRRARNSVAWFFFRRRGQFSLIFFESVVSYSIPVDGQTNSEIC